MSSSGLPIGFHAPTEMPAREGWLSGIWRFVVAALLIPQLPTLLWCMATQSTVYFRGWINLEYLVLLGIAFLFPSWWTITLLTTEMCIALVEPVASLYYIAPRDVLPSIRYLLWLPAPRLIEYAFLLIAYAIGVAVALRATLGGHRRKDAKRMVALVLVCCLLTLTTSGGIDFASQLQAPALRKAQSGTTAVVEFGAVTDIGGAAGWQQAGYYPGAYRILGAG